MDEHFTTSSLAKLFGTSDQTVKNWAKEFAEYLSPSAKPPAGQRRVFTFDDCRVFALVNDYHRRGFGYDAVHASLGAGQRGDFPPDSGMVPSIATSPAFLALKNDRDDLRLLNKQLETERDEARGQVKLLKEQLDQREQRVSELLEENADLKARLKRK
jgi:DNA-binding transcriptional MerR regulator